MVLHICLYVFQKISFFSYSRQFVIFSTVKINGFLDFLWKLQNIFLDFLHTFFPTDSKFEQIFMSFLFRTDEII